MILDILATVVLAYFLVKEGVAVLEVQTGPYEAKPLWLAIGIVILASIVLVAWAVWA